MICDNHPPLCRTGFPILTTAFHSIHVQEISMRIAVRSPIAVLTPAATCLIGAVAMTGPAFAQAKQQPAPPKQAPAKEAAPAPVPEAKQVALTEKQIESVIASQKDFDALGSQGFMTGADPALFGELPEGAEFKKLTQAFNSGLSKVARGVSLATRHLGGVHLYRDRQGDGHAPFEPVPAETQRKSLNLILDTMFAEDSLKVKPELAARLARDRFEARGDQNQHTGSVIVAQQGVALAALYDSGLAQRLIDSPEKVGADVSLPSLPEVYDAIQTKVWSELGAGKEISQGRRDLQREQLRQVLEMIKPDSKAPGEAISVMRYVAGELGKQIDKAMEGQLSIQTRAHLDQCRQKLTKALA